MAQLSEVLREWIGLAAATLMILWCVMIVFVLLNFNPPE